MKINSLLLDIKRIEHRQAKEDDSKRDKQFLQLLKVIYEQSIELSV